MALFDNADVDTTEEAFMWNQMYRCKGYAFISRARPVLLAALGIMSAAATPLGETKFEKLTTITGTQIEETVLGKVFTPYYISDGSDEMTTVDLAAAYANDYWGAMKFDLAHLGWTHPVPNSELMRIKGKEAKIDSFVEKLNDLIMESYLTKYGAEFGSTGAPARNKLAGYQFLVSDTGTYGQIDRAATGNGDFQSYVLDATGAFNIHKFRKMRNRITKNGGVARLAVVNENGYTALESILDGYTTIENDKGDLWRRFGGEYIQVGRCKFALDADAPANQCVVFDTDYIAVWNNDTPFTQRGIERASWTKAGNIIQTEVWMQILATRLNVHARATSCGFE